MHRLPVLSRESPVSLTSCLEIRIMKLKLRYHAIKCLLSIDDDFNREFVFTECVVSALKIIARARVVSTDSLTDMAP